MAEEEWGGDGPLAKTESGVPEPRLWVIELLHQCDAVGPGQLCKRRLHNPQVWIGNSGVASCIHTLGLQPNRCASAVWPAEKLSRQAEHEPV